MAAPSPYHPYLLLFTISVYASEVVLFVCMCIVSEWVVCCWWHVRHGCTFWTWHRGNVQYACLSTTTLSD